MRASAGRAAGWRPHWPPPASPGRSSPYAACTGSRWAKASPPTTRPPTSVRRKPPQRLPKALSLDQVQAMLDVPATDTALGPARRRPAGAALRHRHPDLRGREPGRRRRRRTAGAWPTASRRPGCGCSARGARSGSCRSGSYARAALEAYLVRARPVLAARGRGTPGPVPERPGRPAVPAERLVDPADGRRAGRDHAPTSRRTPCGTPSPPTCWTAGPTYGWSRSCSATPR